MDKFQLLKQLGAGEFKHLNGSLVTHLEATRALLLSWENSEILCDAGLFHAAYGTDGFDQALVSVDLREQIAEIIGRPVELLVYLYCACDRSYVFPRIGGSNQIEFRDRFTGEQFCLTESQSRSFCELTVANEMELIIASEEFRQTHAAGLFTLFGAMRPFLSKLAIMAYRLEQQKLGEYIK